MHYGIVYTRKIQYGQLQDVTVGFLNKYREKGAPFINFRLRVPNSQELPAQKEIIAGLIEYLNQCGFKIQCERPHKEGDEHI